MQQTIGNQAVMRRLGRSSTGSVVQRMPTKQMILDKLKEPKEKSTKYRAVLDAVYHYDEYIKYNTVAPDMPAITHQFQRMLELLQVVSQAIARYGTKLGFAPKTKKKYMLGTLKPEVEAETEKVKATFTKLVKNPNAFKPNVRDAQLPLLQVALGRSTGTDTLTELSPNDEIKKERGGSSEVTEFRQGYFKPDKNKLVGTDKFNQDPRYVEETGKAQNKTQDEQALIRNALFNEYYLGVGRLGIDPNNAHMANRDIAMARLDQLLGGGVIARAKMAVRTDTGEQGSLMEKAKGFSASKLMEHNRFDLNKPQIDNPEVPSFRVQDDPNLMRLLSRLQLIDLLCIQVDRSPANFFLQFDNSGNVIGLTGIDNDYSLGTNTNIEGKNKELPGISRFVDKELAQRIIQIDFTLVALALQDLLSPDEMEALKTRFEKLKATLQEEQTQLLEPEQWTQQIALELRNEKKSYFSGLDYFQKKLGPKE